MVSVSCVKHNLSGSFSSELNTAPVLHRLGFIKLTFFGLSFSLSCVLQGRSGAFNSRFCLEAEVESLEHC